MHRIINKRVGIVAGVAAALVLGGSAFAYFTSTGSGSGSANVGTSTAVEITSSSSGNLFPGAKVPVAITITNKGSGTEYVNAVEAKKITASETGCLSTWFSMANVNVEAEIASGHSVEKTGMLEMLNESTSQNACQDATVTVEYAGS